MFLENKYTKLYYALINNALTSNGQDQYTEKHHIIPKCMGGDDSPANLVNLSAREHFLAHKLLCKMVDDPVIFRKLSYAFWRMCVPQTKKHERRKVLSRDYDLAKRQLSQAMKNDNPMFREDIVKQFRRKRPEQSKVCKERNDAYWADENNRKKAATVTQQLKSKQWKVTNILSGQIFITDRLKEFCQNNDINYDGLRSAMNASRVYKKEWVLESTHS